VPFRRVALVVLLALALVAQSATRASAGAGTTSVGPAGGTAAPLPPLFSSTPTHARPVANPAPGHSKCIDTIHRRRETATDKPVKPATDTPAIVSVYPNPVATEDRGEFVVVRLPAGTHRNLTLTDGETTVHLPPKWVSGTVALSTTPDAVRNLTDLPVCALRGSLSLSNAGERLRLRRANRTLDSVSYAGAPEGELWTGTAWRPLGATAFAVESVRNVSVRAFVLPDDPAVPLATLQRADHRILLAGYTLTSRRVATALETAARDGVRVEVLVEGGPVGGVERSEAGLLDELTAAGVSVVVLDGPYARYDFHHAKYAVVDDRAMVATENWKPAGVGGRSSRGWGVVVRSRAMADDLAAVFRADVGWRDAVPWRRFRANETFQPGETATGSYPSRFRARTLGARRVRLLVAPDDAETALVALLRSADHSILVEQMGAAWGTPVLRATIAAARRGVHVRVLLSSAWYARDRNGAVAKRLNRLARREQLPLQARLVDPRSRFEKVHAKAVVVDGRTVVVGSLNWNNHSFRQNREVAVVLSGRDVGTYYSRVFAADWHGGAWRLPAGVAVLVVVVLLGALRQARREISFGGAAVPTGGESPD